MLKRFLQEPLVHFAVLGALLFVALSSGRTPEADISREILISRGQIDSLAQLWQRTWQRQPTASELAGIIDDYVREEIFYREARAMGLDENDSVIRRRLRQKLEFLAEDFAAMNEPTDEELQAYLNDDVERYAQPPRLSFTQIFFSAETPGSDAEGRAAALLRALRDGTAQESDQNTGDPLPLPRLLEDVSLPEVERLFGVEFAEAVQNVPAGSWQGPLSSAYGQHLVRVNQRQARRVPSLDEVRGAVRRDWLADRQRAAKEEYFQSLRAKYTVQIEAADGQASAAGKPSQDIP